MQKNAEKRVFLGIFHVVFDEYVLNLRVLKKEKGEDVDASAFLLGWVDFAAKFYGVACYECCVSSEVYCYRSTCLAIRPSDEDA